MGTEPRSLDEALLDGSSQYVERSEYHARLRPYLERFPVERIAIVLQEDLLARRHETISSLYRFAGVDDGFWSPEFDKLLHVGGPLPVPTERLERRLSALLAEDVARLRLFTGRELSEWRAY